MTTVYVLTVSTPVGPGDCERYRPLCWVSSLIARM